MRSRVSALVLALCVVSAVAACSGGSPTDAGSAGANSAGNASAGSASPSPSVASTTVTASPNLVDDDGRFLTITEVGFGDAGYVSLSNITSVPASLTGLSVCQGSDCVQLPDTSVEGGQSAIVAVGDGTGLEDVVVDGAALDLTSTGGEVGLYAGQDVTAALDVRAYIEWGSTPHEGTAAAVEAGLWLEGSYVESSADSTRIVRGDDAMWRSE